MVLLSVLRVIAPSDGRQSVDCVDCDVRVVLKIEIGMLRKKLK